MDEKRQKIYDIKKRSYVYALDMVKFLRQLPSDYISQTLGKQLLRSATSVGANIIEAQASASKRDFVNFYRHSLKSANESRFWLELIRDSTNEFNEKTKELIEETIELSNILASCIITMKEKGRSLLAFAFWFLLFPFYFCF